MIGSQQPVTFLLIMMIALFLLTILAYYLIRLNKQKKLHATYIIGTWQRSGQSEAGDSWKMNYTFSKNGQFSMVGSPTFTMKGKYKIVKEVENLLTLELSALSGDGNTKKQRIQLAVEKKNNQLRIDNRLYGRIG